MTEEEGADQRIVPLGWVIPMSKEVGAEVLT
jgi:hypothetical protein